MPSKDSPDGQSVVLGAPLYFPLNDTPDKVRDDLRVAVVAFERHLGAMDDGERLAVLTLERFFRTCL
jgi:hypothetical protein